MKPTIVDEISHFPVSCYFEPDLSASRESIVRVVLKVFISVSVLAYTLAIESLVLELLVDIPEEVD